MSWFPYELPVLFVDFNEQARHRDSPNADKVFALLKTINSSSRPVGIRSIYDAALSSHPKPTVEAI
jgi:hypothetical protein